MGAAGTLRWWLGLTLLAAVPGARGPADAEEVRLAWEQLEGIPGNASVAWMEAFAALESLGEEAALHGLETFAGADPAGRLARARLVHSAGGARCVPAVVALLDVADDAARLELVGFLGRRDLGTAGAEARIEALARIARDDLVGEVRSAAVEGLARVADPRAVDRLDALLDEVADPERVAVARTLAGLADGRPHLVRRVLEAFAPPAAPGSNASARPRRPLDPRSLAVLLDRYGEVLAQLPGGGASAAERRPLVLGRDDPVPIVRFASRTALDGLFGRLAEVGDLARAERLAADLVQEGLNPRDLAFRRAVLTLTRGTQPEAARAAAAELVASGRFSDDLEDRHWRVRGLFLLAAAETVAGDPDGARRALDEAARVIEGLFGERLDLVPSEREPALAGADASVGFLQWRALVELWRGFLLLLDGAEPGDAEVTARLRRMHVLLLEAQLLAIQTRSRMPVESLAVVLADPLGPIRLVLSNPDSVPFPSERALALQVELGSAIAGIAAYEMPGFPVPTGQAAYYEPLQDRERRALLIRLRNARIEAIPLEVQEELSRPRPDPDRLQELRIERLILLNRSTEDPVVLDSTVGGDALLEARYPSQLALDLAQALRADDSPAEGRALAERMHADLLAQAARGRGALNEWMIARIEVAIGSSYMDEGRPEDAEREFLRAAGRLESVEEDLAARLAEAGGDDLQLEGLIAQTRARRADALLSLAVNANVRKGDPELALDYFEEAFELSKSDFMRVLLACYRARGGRADEARAVLAEVVPSPTLYYNLACTHALLGDDDLALDYLARDLDENHGSRRARARQAEWAREDPDLASLRDDPRFAAVLAPRPEASVGEPADAEGR